MKSVPAVFPALRTMPLRYGFAVPFFRMRRFTFCLNLHPLSASPDGPSLQSRCRSALFRRLKPMMLAGFALWMNSCGSTTETIVVGGEARALEAAAPEREVFREEATLPVIRMGEVNRIRSMDPLFAVNTATKRAIMLAYEGLVRLDSGDNVVPAIAARWDISEDSLTYTFILRRNAFFHNDESFTHGVGRIINSRDVLRVFQRMASREVPPDAAHLFMHSVRGFESYFLEQREVFFEQDRELPHIEGIRIPNDTTVVFELTERDPAFLYKLSSPYAVLYPMEPFRFRDSGLHRHAVGSGPFRFERITGDSLFTFRRNEDYYLEDSAGRPLPRVQRVEIIHSRDESGLYDYLLQGRIHLIPELGPQGVLRFVDHNHQLKPDFNEDFRLLIHPNSAPFIVNYHSRNRFGLNRTDAAAVLRHTHLETLNEQIPVPILRIAGSDETFSQSNIIRVFQRFGFGHPHQLVFAFHQDRMPEALSRAIVETIDENLQTRHIQSRVFSRDIFLYLNYDHSFIPGAEQERGDREVLRIHTHRYSISSRNLQGIETNSLNWWINLNRIHPYTSTAQHFEIQ